MKQNYIDRAMRARDPRYAKILARLGYDTKRAAPPEPVDDLAEARADYLAKFGKKPFHGWGAATLRAKIDGEGED